MRMKLLMAATVLVLLLSAPASGDLIRDDGEVDDWGFTPFTESNRTNVFQGGTYVTIADDYAPIDYPCCGRVPSPGGTRGEKSDLEQMRVRFGQDSMQVLVVTSSGFSFRNSGSDVHLGDLFVTVGAQRFGIVTQEDNQGLAPGRIYRIDSDNDVRILQDVAGTYLNKNTLVENDYGPPATIRDVAGPWALAGGIALDQLLGQASLDFDVHSYGDGEDGTLVLEYTFDPGLLGLAEGGPFTTHLAWGCGNDVIRVDSSPSPIPEPATAVMLAIGSVLCVAQARRVKRQP